MLVGRGGDHGEGDRRWLFPRVVRDDEIGVPLNVLGRVAHAFDVLFHLTSAEPVGAGRLCPTIQVPIGSGLRQRLRRERTATAPAR